MSTSRFPPISVLSANITGLTSTQVLFGVSTGKVGQSAAFTWNDSTKVLSVGTSETPVVTSATVQIYGTSNAFMIVRDTTNDVEMSMGNASTTGVIGSQTNHRVNLITNNTARCGVPAAGGFVVGTAALATNVTDGFLYIPTCAGTPSGTPTTQTGTVAMIYDTSANKLMIYNAAWKGGTAPGAWS